MHEQYGNHHVDAYSECCDATQKSNQQTDSSQELREDCQDREHLGNAHGLGESPYGLAKPGASKPAQYLLSPVREKHKAENHAQEH